MSADPDPKGARLAREAEGYYELQLYEESLERVDRLLAHPKVGRFARSMRAECLRCLERYEEGALAFRALTEEEPENIAAWVGLGWCFKRTDRLDLARGAMEGMLAANPGEAIGLFNLACYLALEDRTALALEYLRKAVAADEQYRSLAHTEEDFAAMRDDPEFQRILRK